MSRTIRPRTARAVALVYVVAMVVGGLVLGAQGPSHGGSSLVWLSQPGLNFLYVFVLVPLTVVFGDLGGGGGDAGPFSLALSCGLGAVVNVLLVRAVVCFGRMVAADLPVCRKRRTPAR